MIRCETLVYQSRLSYCLQALNMSLVFCVLGSNDFFLPLLYKIFSICTAFGCFSGKVLGFGASYLLQEILKLSIVTRLIIRLQAAQFHSVCAGKSYSKGLYVLNGVKWIYVLSRNKIVLRRVENHVDDVINVARQLVCKCQRRVGEK